MFCLNKNSPRVRTPNASGCPQIILFLRSLVPFIFGILTIFPYSFVCVAIWPLPLRYRHALIRSFLKMYLYVLRKFCHMSYQVEGLENLPEGSGIIFCKHQSTWETFFLPIQFHNVAIILKRELLWVPFFGWGLATLDPIVINRGDKRGAMQQIIEKGRKCLEAGRSIIVFPEGTRTAPGTVGKYHIGGARLAASTGYPVIPIAHNAGRFWPRRSFMKYPGLIRVVIGPAIESKGRTPEEILNLAKHWIEGTMLEIDGFFHESAGQ